MRKITTLLLTIVALPLLASAQEWTFSNPVPDTSQFVGSRHVHGIAVDRKGHVWVQPYYPDHVLVPFTFKDQNGDDSVGTVKSGGILIYDFDGTPLDTVAYAPDLGDTLGGAVNSAGNWEWNSGRGLRYDAENNVVWAAFFNNVYKIDADTHNPKVKIISEGGSPGAPAVDAEGNVYIGPVVGANASIKKYNGTTGDFIEDVGTPGGSFSRSMEVSADGNKFYWAGYTNAFVMIYSRADEFSAYGADADTVLHGIKSETFTFHPTSDKLWVGGGSANDVPGVSPQGYYYNINTWYEFDVDDLGTANEVPSDSITWHLGVDDANTGRPRGLAFTQDGLTAYISLFSQDAPAVQRWTYGDVTNIDDNTNVPVGYKLNQNFPNPFNPTTNIEFELGDAGYAKLVVYDMLGREVANLIDGFRSAGQHTVTFDAARLSSGTYIYMLEANGVKLTNKMTLIK